MDILAYDPIVRPDESQYPVKATDSMEEVFSSSDIVSLHIPLNDSTREIVDQRLFDRMKEGAYFINTCRGGVVKEEDLIRALRSGRLRGCRAGCAGLRTDRSRKSPSHDG